MVAMLAFGGTFAYFTATATKIDSDTVTTGTVAIANGEGASITKTFTADYAVPGDTLWTVNVTLNSTSNVKTYIFAIWELTNESNATLTVSPPSGWTPLTDGESSNVEGVYYQEVEADTDSVSYASNVVFATSNGNNMQGKTISCSLQFHASQFDHFDDAYAAYTNLGLGA